MAYIAYCVDCGAKHEVENDEGCMCGGKLVDADTLGRLAHRLWAHWSMHIADADDVAMSNVRRDRWKELWVPYDELGEGDQQQDLDLVVKHLSTEPDY